MLIDNGVDDDTARFVNLKKCMERIMALGAPGCDATRAEVIVFKNEYQIRQ